MWQVHWLMLNKCQSELALNNSRGLARQQAMPKACYGNIPKAVHSYLALLHSTCHTYTRIHQSITFLSCANTTDLYMVSALRSRVGWTSARNNEQTKEHMNEWWAHPKNQITTAA